MRRLRWALLTAFTALAVGGITTAAAATPNVGHHVHVKVAGLPADGVIVNGVHTFHVTVLSHNQIGTVRDVRLDSEKGVMARWTVNLAPCGAACSYEFDATVDFAKWPTGRHEMRWRGEIPKSTDQEQNSSSGVQVCVRSCSPSYRSGPYLEARGWYTDHGYQNARLTSSLCGVRSGATIKVSLNKGSGGKATKFAGVYINPDFHAGSHGTLVKTWSGPFKGSVSLPNVAEPFKLVLLASDGQDAGVLVVSSGQCGSTFTFEDQAWWAREGIVVP
jgi:hypothetical protein